jgi:hypothetical protein
MTDGSNGYDRGLLEQLLTEIDQADEDLASLKGEYMQNCKGPRETIAGVFDRAKDAGIPRKPFRTLVKNRRLDKQVAANVAKLEDDQRAELEQLEVALGDFLDTDLGQAAARRARPDGDATLDNLAAP